MRRWIGVSTALCLFAGGAVALAAPSRTPQGWNITGVSGSYTVVLSAPGLGCAGDVEPEQRVASGTYRATFTGAAMNRSRRFRADVSFNGAAAGPAGFSVPVGVTLKRDASEVVQTRTVDEDDEGDTTCAVSSRTCTAADTRSNRSAENKLVFQIVSATRLRVTARVPSAPSFATCAGDASAVDDVWPSGGFAETVPLSKVNARRSTWRIAWSGAVKRDSRSATIAYRLTFTLVRNPGTPRAYCRVLCRRP